MREAIGNSFLFYFVIVFVVLFILFFVGSLAYTKAFKVKNRIVDIIESNDGNILNNENSNALSNNVNNEINNNLREMGYRVDTEAQCNQNGRFETYTTVNKPAGTYRYCIYEKKVKKGKYYAVVAYMYFQVPIIGAYLEFPVYGETKLFYDLNS